MCVGFLGEMLVFLSWNKTTKERKKKLNILFNKSTTKDYRWRSKCQAKAVFEQITTRVCIMLITKCKFLQKDIYLNMNLVVK